MVVRAQSPSPNQRRLEFLVDVPDTVAIHSGMLNLLGGGGHGGFFSILLVLFALMRFALSCDVESGCDDDSVALLQQRPYAKMNPEMTKLEELVDAVKRLQEGQAAQMKELADVVERLHDGQSAEAKVHAQNVSVPAASALPQKPVLFQACKARTKKKFALSQKMAHAEEKQAANTTRYALCGPDEVLLTKYGSTNVQRTCCTASSMVCAGCAQAAGQACLECAGGFIKRGGRCIACADSAGWRSANKQTCAQLAFSDCSDVKVGSKSSNEACCICGGGVVSATPFSYPAVHLALGSPVDVLPSPMTASHYSLNEDCELSTYNLTMNGATGAITQDPGKLMPKEAFSIECLVTAHQALGAVLIQPADPSSMVAWFRSEDAAPEWESAVGSWKGRVTEGSVSIVFEAGNGATKPVQYLSGNTDVRYDFGKIMKPDFTICSITRYIQAGRRKRILTNSAPNFLHGHHDGRTGVAHYQRWVVNTDSLANTDWLVMCGNNNRIVFAGEDRTNIAVNQGNRYGADFNLYINEDGESSDFGVMEVITWNRALDEDEMWRSMEYLNAKLKAETVTYEASLKISMDALGYGSPLLVFQGASPSKAAMKAPGEWRNFEVACAPSTPWLQVDPASGALTEVSQSPGATAGSVDTEDTQFAGQKGGICVVKALHKGLSAGLRGDYYYGNFACTVPSLGDSDVVHSVIVPEIDFDNNFPEVRQPGNWCFRLTGYLGISYGGSYRFTLSSDDGSRLYLNGALLINNDGCGYSEVTGQTSLETGHHVLEVHFCEGGGSESLRLQYEGPDSSNMKITVPATAFFHDSDEEAFTEQKARVVALSPQPWTSLAYQTHSVSVTLGEQIPLIKVRVPPGEYLLRPSSFKVAATVNPSSHKFSFDELLGAGLLEGYSLLEVTADGSISIAPDPGLVAVFDTMSNSDSVRQRILLNLAIWGDFPSVMGLEPLKAEIQVELLDNICWVQTSFTEDSYSVVPGTPSNNEAECRSQCRQDESCPSFVHVSGRCRRYWQRATQSGAVRTVYAKVTDCTVDTTCMEVEHPDWYKGGRYCPVATDLFRNSVLYRKDGLTSEETIYLATFSSSLDGAQNGCEDGDWILRKVNPELDYVEGETGEVSLRGEALGCSPAFQVRFSASSCQQPANLTAAAEEEEGRSPFILDDPGTTGPADYTLHHCECAPRAWGTEEPVTPESFEAIPPGSNNVFIPPPFDLATGQMVCPAQNLISVHYETDAEAMERSDCESRCKAEARCEFYWHGTQSAANTCRLYWACGVLLREIGLEGDLVAVPREESCLVANPDKCFAVTARRSYLTNEDVYRATSLSSAPFRYWTLHVHCDIHLILGGGGAEYCARPKYRVPTSHEWQHKSLLPQAFSHGNQLSVSCWDERYSGIYDSSSRSGTLLTCVNGKWFNEQNGPGLGKFGCHKCVQVGSRGFGEVHKQNLQEIWFFKHLPLTLWTEASSAHCLQFGDADNELVLNQALCSQNVKFEFMGNTLSSNRVVKLLEGDNQCMESVTVDGLPVPVHKTCNASEPAQQIPADDLTNMLWNLHTTRFNKVSRAFSPGSINCGGSGGGAVGQVSMRQLFQEDRIASVMGVVDLNVDEEWTARGPGNWEQVASGMELRYPYPEAQLMRACISFTDDINAPPFTGLQIQLSKAGRADPLLDDNFGSTFSAGGLFRNLCGPWRLVQPGGTCSGTNPCKILATHRNGVRVHLKRYVLEYARTTPLERTGTYLGRMLFVENYRGSGSAAWMRFQVASGDTEFWPNTTRFEGFSSAACEFGSACAHRPGRTTKLRCFRGEATHFRVCMLWWDYGGSSDIVGMQIRRAGAGSFWQHNFVSSRARTTYDCSPWSADIGRLAECGQSRSLCRVFRYTSNEFTTHIYKLHMEFKNDGAPSSPSATAAVIGSYNLPIDPSSKDRVVPAGDGEWAKVSEGLGLAMNMTNYDVAVQFRLCVAFSNDRAGGSFKLRIRRDAWDDADNGPPVMVEEEFFATAESSTAFFHHTCGVRHDVRLLSCGGWWGIACIVDIHHSQTGTKVWLDSLQVEFWEKIPDDVCRFAPVVLPSPTQVAEIFKTSEWPEWNDRLADAPVFCPLGEVLTDLNMVDGQLNYRCGVVPGLGSCVEWFTPQQKIASWHDYRGLLKMTVLCKEDSLLNGFHFEFSDGGKWARFRTNCCKAAGVPVALDNSASPPLPAGFDGLYCPQQKDESGRFIYHLMTTQAAVFGATVLIRPADPSSMVAWFRSEDAGPEWESAVGSWKGRVISGSVTIEMKAGNGAIKPVQYLSGNTDARYDFGKIMKPDFTICSITRYVQGGTQRRILSNNNPNFLHGHHYGKAGVAYYKSWVTSQDRAASTDWIVLCGNNRRLVFLGEDSTNIAIHPGVLHDRDFNLYINEGFVYETSDFGVMEVITWNRALDEDEMWRSMEYLNAKLKAGTVGASVAERDLRLQFSLTEGKWSLIDSSGTDWATEVDSRVIPVDLKGSNWEATELADFDGEFQSTGLPKVVNPNPATAALLRKIKSPKRPKQPSAPKLEGFEPEEPTYSAECVDYSQLWKTITETYKDKISGEVTAHEGQLKAEAVVPLPEESPCAVAASVTATKGVIGGGDGSDTGEKINYRELDECDGRSGVRGLKSAKADFDGTIAEHVTQLFSVVNGLGCDAAGQVEVAPLGLGMEIAVVDLCKDIFSIYQTVASFANPYTGFGKAKAAYDSAKEDDADCSAQASLDRLFCDIHCVRDAVVRGDRAILRNLKAATDVTNRNLRAMAEWSVEANRAALAESSNGITWFRKRALRPRLTGLT
ncbi:unnamed protein product [Symbiodinium sp. CCMP2592]|nr:unnamed protein product [Symbiodinium sp. CCMP2592]